MIFLSLSYYVKGQLFWGVDRLYFVERLLGRKEAGPERLAYPSPVRERERGRGGERTHLFMIIIEWRYSRSDILL